MSTGLDTRPETEEVDTQPSVAIDQPVGRLGDRIFSGMTLGSGVLILLILAGVALFLFFEALPYFGDQLNDDLDPNVSFISYIWPLVFGTVYAASLALAMAIVPAVGVALFISHYAPRRLARTIGTVIDLLAAIPSVVYGLWGVAVLGPILGRTFYPWAADNLAWIPLFGRMFNGPALTSGRTMLTAAIVLAVMILPIITAISREVFLQTPPLHEEASLALGATKWEVIKLAVLPYSRSAVTAGAMLALGRALGETMALAIVLSPVPELVTVNAVSSQNSQGIAPNIALQFPESSGIEVDRLIASGLVLFAITLAVNLIARRLIAAGGAK